MHFLVGLVANLFSSLFSTAFKYFTKRWAVSIAVLGTFLTLTAAFLGGLKTLMAGVTYAMPEFLSIAWGWFMPTNFSACLSAILSAEALAWVYRKKIDIERILFPFGKF